MILFTNVVHASIFLMIFDLLDEYSSKISSYDSSKKISVQLTEICLFSLSYFASRGNLYGENRDIAIDNYLASILIVLYLHLSDENSSTSISLTNISSISIIFLLHSFLRIILNFSFHWRAEYNRPVDCAFKQQKETRLIEQAAPVRVYWKEIWNDDDTGVNYTWQIFTPLQRIEIVAETVSIAHIFVQTNIVPFVKKKRP